MISISLFIATLSMLAIHVVILKKTTKVDFIWQSLLSMGYLWTGMLWLSFKIPNFLDTYGLWAVLAWSIYVLIGVAVWAHAYLRTPREAAENYYSMLHEEAERSRKKYGVTDLTNFYYDEVVEIVTNRIRAEIERPSENIVFAWPVHIKTEFTYALERLKK